MTIQQYLAHEQPVIFWSCVMGTAGPVLALTVPSIRQKYFGYVPAERVPTTYPREPLLAVRTVDGLFICLNSKTAAETCPGI
ncbi:hypothetical protein OG21DRAFT_1462628 [Imleria badia]|nr:hypothetical protein OG21DRAFT_1462628 [Imleria badia]